MSTVDFQLATLAQLIRMLIEENCQGKNCHLKYSKKWKPMLKELAAKEVV